MLKSKKTPLDIIQSKSRPPGIDEHIRKVDPSFLNHQNWFRNGQNMTKKKNFLTEYFMEELGVTELGLTELTLTELVHD